MRAPARNHLFHLRDSQCSTYRAIPSIRASAISSFVSVIRRSRPLATSSPSYKIRDRWCRPHECVFFASCSDGSEARIQIRNVMSAIRPTFAALLLSPLRLILSPFFDYANVPFPVALSRYRDGGPINQSLLQPARQMLRCSETMIYTYGRNLPHVPDYCVSLPMLRKIRIGKRATPSLATVSKGRRRERARMTDPDLGGHWRAVRIPCEIAMAPVRIAPSEKR